MPALTDGSRFARRAVIGDLVALFLFLVLGIERHAENVPGRFVSLAVIFVASWLATAWAVGTYRPTSTGRLVVTLVLAVPLAVAIRAVIVGVWSTSEVLTFMAVALWFCTAFVATARLLLLLVERRRST
jgi:Protein of unknown function (DUF3054)